MSKFDLEELAEALANLKQWSRLRHETHTHCCGFTLDDQTQSGCGHRWTHQGPSIFDEQGEYKERHHCPKCGKGPWYWQVTDETLEEYDRRRAAGEIT
jgi:hypothetical protein